MDIRTSLNTCLGFVKNKLIGLFDVGKGMMSRTLNNTLTLTGLTYLLHAMFWVVVLCLIVVIIANVMVRCTLWGKEPLMKRYSPISRLQPFGLIEAKRDEDYMATHRDREITTFNCGEASEEELDALVTGSVDMVRGQDACIKSFLDKSNRHGYASVYLKKGTMDSFCLFTGVELDIAMRASAEELEYEQFMAFMPRTWVGKQSNELMRALANYGLRHKHPVSVIRLPSKALGIRESLIISERRYPIDSSLDFDFTKRRESSVFAGQIGDSLRSILEFVKTKKNRFRLNIRPCYESLCFLVKRGLLIPIGCLVGTEMVGAVFFANSSGCCELVCSVSVWDKETDNAMIGSLFSRTVIMARNIGREVLVKGSEITDKTEKGGEDQWTLCLTNVGDNDHIAKYLDVKQVRPKSQTSVYVYLWNLNHSPLKPQDAFIV